MRRLCLPLVLGLLTSCGGGGGTTTSGEAGRGGGGGTVVAGPGGSGGGTGGRAGGGGLAAAGGSTPGTGGTSGAAGTQGGTAGAAGHAGGATGTAGHAGGTTGAGGHAGSGGTAGSDGGAGGAKVALANPPPATGFFVGANFWNIDWEGSADFFQSGVNFATTTNPWVPQLLTDLAPYHVLRFMDWNLTNDSNNPQAVWSTRTQKTAPQAEPVAFEWQIDLCNRTKKDYWLNVPHEASPSYWTQLAQLVAAQLDPSLRVYVEWSNEVWNGGFPQHAYATSHGQSLALPGSDPEASYYVYESVRMYEAFEAVFGKGSPRLVKVLSGQAAYNGPCTNDIAALPNTTINPNKTMPDVYAIAPYISGTTVAAVKASISGVASWVSMNATCAAMASLPIISYEGGSDSYSASNCQAVQTDPGMHDVYTAYLDALVGDGLKGPFMQYTHTGSCWGLKVKTTDPNAAAPKYQGLLDWLAAHP